MTGKYGSAGESAGICKRKCKEKRGRRKEDYAVLYGADGGLDGIYFPKRL